MQHHNSTSKLNQTSDPFIHIVVPQPANDFSPATNFFQPPSTENSHPSHNEPNHNDNNDLTDQPNIPKRSSRNIHLPAYLNEYIASMPNLQSSNYICHSISYDKLSTAYRNFVMQLSSIYEPTYYHQAFVSLNGKLLWIKSLKQWILITHRILFLYLKTKRPSAVSGFTR